MHSIIFRAPRLPTGYYIHMTARKAALPGVVAEGRTGEGRWYFERGALCLGTKGKPPTKAADRMLGGNRTGLVGPGSPRAWSKQPPSQSFEAQEQATGVPSTTHKESVDHNLGLCCSPIFPTDIACAGRISARSG